MKKILITLVVLLVFALDWAALHDILKGEADARLEWTMLAVSAALALGVAGLWAWKKLRGLGKKV